MCKHLPHKTAPDGKIYEVLENVSKRGIGKADCAGELLSSEISCCELAAKIFLSLALPSVKLQFNHVEQD